MPRSGDYNKGFVAGWLAASQAIVSALSGRQPSAPLLEMAGSIPSSMRRRRGRPPKSVSVGQSPLTQQSAKRKRGRPG